MSRQKCPIRHLLVRSSDVPAKETVIGILWVPTGLSVQGQEPVPSQEVASIHGGGASGRDLAHIVHETSNDGRAVGRAFLRLRGRVVTCCCNAFNIRSGLHSGRATRLGRCQSRVRCIHSPRFAFVLNVLRAAGVTSSSRILDIGASQLTSLIAKEFDAQIESMGMEDGAKTNGFTDHHFDLNAVQDRSQWKMDVGPYDIIVFAEVLEHLYTAPELVLRYLRELLLPGGVLLLQTPNAVALRKRVKMAIGANPFERIRVQRDNPGHFREYTASELRQVLVGAGFSIDRVWMQHDPRPKI
jgi:2-polyprenyl-3-methyl-5-hydroxy-6-metoxy-1,4-benzoquinol methylase